MTDPETRQASHVFLYFATSENTDCFQQVDAINSAYQKAVVSYGADSVAFYKVLGGLFAQEFNVHTYPSFVYVDGGPND